MHVQHLDRLGGEERLAGRAVEVAAALAQGDDDDRGPELAHRRGRRLQALGAAQRQELLAGELDQVAARQEAEDAFFAAFDPDTATW